MLANSDGHLSEYHKEVVAPDDGHREGRWVLLTITLILLLGGFSISVHQAEQVKLPEYLSLSVTDKAVLTALRNAGDEILFLAEDGSPLPTVSSLSADGIPPFSLLSSSDRKYQWQLVEGRCYIGTPLKAGQQDSVQFLLSLNNESQVYWRPLVDSHDHASEHGALSCVTDEHWQVFKNA